MKYVSIDIETTGLNREFDQVLQLALVVEDTDKTSGVEVEDLPSWEGLIYHERLSGDPFALRMNSEIIDALCFDWDDDAPGPKVVDFRGRRIRVYRDLELAVDDALDFLAKAHDTKRGVARVIVKRGIYVAAGKNAASFDLPFIGGLFKTCFHHRVIDVGSVALGARGKLWGGNRIPGLADLHDGKVTHDALEDARVVVQLLRKLTNWYQGSYVPGSENP